MVVMVAQPRQLPGQEQQELLGAHLRLGHLHPLLAGLVAVLPRVLVGMGAVEILIARVETGIVYLVELGVIHFLYLMEALLVEMRQQDKALVGVGMDLRVPLRHKLGVQEVTELLS
jgi:hypothetical protein